MAGIHREDPQTAVGLGQGGGQGAAEQSGPGPP